MLDFPANSKALLGLPRNMNCRSSALQGDYKFSFAKVLRYFILLGIAVLALSCNKASTKDLPQNNMSFPKSLHDLKLFKGVMADLTPRDNVQQLELSSTLFTDYSEKQRLIKLPDGTKMKAQNYNLPEFPEQTILAKTFYYSAAQTGRKKIIIETRVLIKNKSKWNAATYIWNEEQTDAFLSFDGAAIAVDIVDPQGREREIKYKVPTGRDCVDCHSN